MYLGSVREAIGQGTRDFRNRSINKAKGIDVYEAFRTATKKGGEMARASRSRTIQAADDYTTNKRVSTRKDSIGRQETPSPQHVASFEDQLADIESKTSLPESEVNPSPPHRRDSDTSDMRDGGTPRRDSDPMPRRDSDHSTRRDSGPPPQRDSDPPPRRDSDRSSRRGSDHSTRRDSDHSTRRDSGPPPQRDSDPPPRRDSDRSSRRGSDHSTRRDSGPPPQHDSGPPPQRDSDPPPRRDSDRSSRRDSDPPPRRDSDPPPQRDSDRSSRRDSDPSIRRDSDPPPRRDSDPPPRRDSDPPPRRDSDPPPQRDSDRSSRRDSDPSIRRDSDPPPRRDSDPPPRRDSDPPPRRDSDSPPRRDSDPPSRRDSDRSSRRDSDPSIRRDSDPPPRRDSDQSSRRDSDPPPRRDSDRSSRRDSDQSIRRDSDPPTRRDSDQSSRRDSDPPPRRDSDKSSRRDSDPPPQRDSDQSSRRDIDPPPRRDSDPPPRRDSDQSIRRDRDPPLRRDSDQSSSRDSDPPPRRDSDPPPRRDSDQSSRRDSDPPPRRDSDPPPRLDIDPPPRRDIDQSSRRDSDHLPRRDSDPPPRRDSDPPGRRDTEPPPLFNTEPPPFNPLLRLPPMIMPVPGPPIYPPDNKSGKRRPKSQQQPFPPPPIFLLPILPPPMSLNKGATNQPDQLLPNCQTQLSNPDPLRYPPQAYQQPQFPRYNTGEMVVPKIQQCEFPFKTDKIHATSKCCVEKAIYRKLFDMILNREKTQEYSNGHLKQCPCSGHVGMSLPKTKCGAKLDCRETQTSECHYNQTSQTQTDGSLLTDCSRTKTDCTFLQSCPTDQTHVIRCHNLKSVNVKRTETNPAKCFPAHQPGRVVNDCGMKSDRVNTSCVSCVNEWIGHEQDSSQEDIEHENNEKPKTIQFTITRRKNKEGRPSSKPICLNLDVNHLYKFINCHLGGNKGYLDGRGNTAKGQNGCPSENGIEKETQCHSSALEREVSVKSCQSTWISKSCQTVTECGCKETNLKSEKHDKIIQHTDCFASEINKPERNYIFQSRDLYKPKLKCKPTPCYELLGKAECKDKNVKKSSGGNKKHKSDSSCRHEESSSEPSSTTTTSTQHSDKFTRMLKKINSLKEHIGFTKCNITNAMHLTKENKKQTLPYPNTKSKLLKTGRQECVPPPKDDDYFCECKTRPKRRKRVKSKDDVTCENAMQTWLESGIKAAKCKTYEEPQSRTGYKREETFSIHSHSLTTGNTSGNSIYHQNNCVNIDTMDSESDIISKLYSFSQTNKTVTSSANILMANVKMKKKPMNHEDVRRYQHTASLVHNTPRATKPIPYQSSKIHRNCLESKTTNVEKLMKYFYTSKLDVDEIATTATHLGESLISRDSIKTQVDTEISLKSVDENGSSNKSGRTGQSAGDTESSGGWNGDSWTNAPSDTSKGVLDQAMDIHSWIPTMAGRRSDQSNRSADTCHKGTAYISSRLNVDHTMYTREDELSDNEINEGSYSLSDRLQTNNESSQRDYVSNTSVENLSQEYYGSKEAIVTPQNEGEDETFDFKSGIRAHKNTSSYQIVLSPNLRRGAAKDGDVIFRSAFQEILNDHVNPEEERIQVKNAMRIRNNVVEVLRNELGQKHDDDHTRASEDKVISTETKEIPETLSTLTLSSECQTLENGGSQMHSLESHQTHEVGEVVSNEGIKGDPYMSNDRARSSVVGLPQSGNTLPSDEGQRLGHDLERRYPQPNENGDIIQKSEKGREEDWKHNIIYLPRDNTRPNSLSDITLYSLTLSDTNNVLDVDTVSNFLPEEQSNEFTPPIKNSQSQEMYTDPLTSFSELNPISTQGESGFSDNGDDSSQYSCSDSYARAESVRENDPDSHGPKKCSPQKKCKRSDCKEKLSLNRKCEQKLDEQNEKSTAKVETKCKKQTSLSIPNGRQDREGEESKKACKQKKGVSSSAKNIVCRENTLKGSKNESKETVPKTRVDKKMADLTEPSKLSIPHKVKQKCHKKRVCDSTFYTPVCVEGVKNETSVRLRSDSSLFDVPSCRNSAIDLQSENPSCRGKGMNNETLICMTCRKRQYDVWGRCICKCVTNCPEFLNERKKAMCLRMMAQKERLTKLESKIDLSILLCPLLDRPSYCDESTGHSKSNRPTDFQTFNVKTSQLMRCCQKSRPIHRDRFQCCSNKRQRSILERTREERNSYKKLCSYFQSLLQDIFSYKAHRLSMRPPKSVSRAWEDCGGCVTRHIGNLEASSSSSSFSCVCSSSGELFAI